MPLLIRPKPLQGEAFFCYIHRVAEANFATAHELWRLITRAGVHYPQASISSTIYLCPINLIGMKNSDNLLLNIFKICGNLNIRLAAFIEEIEKLMKEE